MSKFQADATPEMRSQYDFSDGVRGKYAARFPVGSRIVVLDPDVSEMFPDANTVNEALRELIKDRKKGQR